MGLKEMCDVCVVKMCNVVLCVCVLAWCLVFGVPSVGMVAGCVLVTCVQHLWKGKEALQARYGSQPTQVCVSLLHVVRCAQVAAFCASRSDDGWLCACLQSFWKGKNPLQARGPANSTLCRSCVAVQMSFVALELLLGPLLAGMMAGCVLVCSTCWSGRVHCLA